MKNLLIISLVSFSFFTSYSQTNDAWKIAANGIDPSNYYGETVANGMIGIVSSA